MQARAPEDSDYTGLPDEEQEVIWSTLRQASKDSLYVLNKGVLGFTALTPDLHLPFCNFQQLDAPLKCAVMPRNHFKSTNASVGKPIWFVINDPQTTINLISAVEENTIGWMAAIQGVFQRNELFKWLFPEVIPPNWNDIEASKTRFTVPRDESLMPEPQPTLQATSIISGQASKHVYHAILDDPINEQTVDKPTLVDRAVKLYKMLESTLQDWQSSTLDLTATPWGFGDVIETAIENEVADGSMLLWKIGAYGNFECSPSLKDPLYLPVGIRPEQLRLKRLFEGSEAEILSATTGEPIFPARYPRPLLERLEKKYGPFLFSCNYRCSAAGSKVLMADFSERPIEDVKPGDEVIGFYFPEAGRPHFKPVRVLGTLRKPAETVWITFESGRRVRVTPDHRWYRYFRRETAQPVYSPVSEGDSVSRFGKPANWGNDVADWAWLSGMLDGEGSISYGAIRICQSYGANPEVCNRLEEVLTRLGIKFSYTENNTKTRVYTLNGGRALLLRFLQSGTAKRRRIEKYLWETTGFHKRDRVISIEPAGLTTVYSLSTETTNYILEGIASRNCDPFDPSQSGFAAEYVHYFRRHVNGRLECDCPAHRGHAHSIHELHLVMTVDPAFSDKDDAAESAITVGGIAPDGCRYLFKAWSDRVEPDKLWIEIAKTCFEFSPFLKDVGVESVASQRLFKFFFEYMQRIKSHLPALEAKKLPDVSIKDLRPDQDIDKKRRIKFQQTFLANGQWHFLPGMDKFMGQYNKFPRCRPIDLLDAWAYLDYMWSVPAQTEAGWAAADMNAARRDYHRRHPFYGG